MAKKIQVDLQARTDKANRDIKKFADKSKSSFDKVKKSSKAASTNMAANWKKATTAIAGVAASMYLLKKAITAVLNAAAEQQRVEIQLGRAMKDLKVYTDANYAALKRYASSLQIASTYGDEQLLPVMTKLLRTFKLSQGEIKTATKLTMDLASAQGIDLKAAMILVGRVYQGEVSHLRRYGIAIKTTGNAAKDTAEGLKALQERFGGSAQAEVEGYIGTIKQLENVWGDFLEHVGIPLLKWATMYSKGLQDIIWFMSRLISPTKRQELDKLNKSLATDIENMKVLKKEMAEVEDKSLLKKLSPFSWMDGPLMVGYIASLKILEERIIKTKKRQRELWEEIKKSQKEQLGLRPPSVTDEFDEEELKKQQEKQKKILEVQAKLVNEYNKLTKSKYEYTKNKLHEEYLATIQMLEKTIESRKEFLMAAGIAWDIYGEKIKKLNIERVKEAKEIRDKEISDNLNHIDKILEAERKKSEEIGILYMQDQMWKEQAWAKEAEAAKKAAEKAKQPWIELGNIIQYSMEDLAVSAMDNFITRITEGGNAATQLKFLIGDMARSICLDITRMIAKMLILKAIQTSMGWFSGLGGGPSVPAGAGYTPSFAEGGVATGPQSGYLAKLHGTELITPLNKGSKAAVSTNIVNNINVTVTTKGNDKEEAEKTGSKIARVIANKIDERIANQLRPGGMLNRGGR